MLQRRDGRLRRESNVGKQRHRRGHRFVVHEILEIRRSLIPRSEEFLHVRKPVVAGRIDHVGYQWTQNRVGVLPPNGVQHFEGFLGIDHRVAISQEVVSDRRQQSMSDPLRNDTGCDQTPDESFCGFMLFVVYKYWVSGESLVNTAVGLPQGLSHRAEDDEAAVPQSGKRLTFPERPEALEALLQRGMQD